MRHTWHQGQQGQGRLPHSTVIPEPTAARPHTHARNRPWPRSQHGQRTGGGGPSAAESSHLPMADPHGSQDLLPSPSHEQQPLIYPFSTQTSAPGKKDAASLSAGAGRARGRWGGRRYTLRGMPIPIAQAGVRDGNPPENSGGAHAAQSTPSPSIPGSKRSHEGFTLAGGLGLFGNPSSPRRSRTLHTRQGACSPPGCPTAL